MDDTMDTLDTEVLDITEQIPAIDPDELDVTVLTKITGGMRWQEFRPSTNVEDRRTPLPPPRPAGFGAPVPLPPRRPQGL